MRLLTIDDLNDPTNDWKPLLEHIAWLGDEFERWKSKDTGFNRVLPIHFGDDTQRTPGLHASELNTCVRQAVYALRGEKRTLAENNDVNMKMRFQLGTMVHSLIQDDFDRICTDTYGRVSFEDEVSIHYGQGMGGVVDQFELSSSADGVFTFCDENGQPYLRLGLEIKTMSDPQFSDAKSPKKEHIQQTTLYQKALDLPLMWFLYYNKSNSNWTRPQAPWVVPYDESEWAKIDARARQAHLHRAAGTLPEREEGMPCKWCPFSDVCNPTLLKLHSTYKRKNRPRRVNK